MDDIKKDAVFRVLDWFDVRYGLFLSGTRCQNPAQLRCPVVFINAIHQFRRRKIACSIRKRQNLACLQDTGLIVEPGARREKYECGDQPDHDVVLPSGPRIIPKNDALQARNHAFSLTAMLLLETERTPFSSRHSGGKFTDAFDPGADGIAGANPGPFWASRGNDIARVEGKEIAMEGDQIERASFHITDEIARADGAVVLGDHFQTVDIGDFVGRDNNRSETE